MLSSFSVCEQAKCMQSFLVCIVGNLSDTRFTPTCACFHSETFGDLFLLFFFCFFFVLLFRNDKKEERWEGRLRGRCMVYKVRIRLRIIIKLPVNPNVTLFKIYMGGQNPKQSLKPHKTQVQSTWVLCTLHAGLYSKTSNNGVVSFSDPPIK